MPEDLNAIYRDIAKKLTAKTIDNLIQTLKTGQAPDLYWKLENSIYQALKYADQQGGSRAKEEYLRLLQDFDSHNGTSQN